MRHPLLPIEYLFFRFTNGIHCRPEYSDTNPVLMGIYGLYFVHSCYCIELGVTSLTHLLANLHQRAAVHGFADDTFVDHRDS